MLVDEVAGLDEVAAALGRKPSWLQRNWLALHEREGFPRKIAGGRFVWPRRAVEAWLRAGGGSSLMVSLPNHANQNVYQPDRIGAARSALDSRYGVTR